MIRRKVLYSGLVQGVGFRYTTQSISRCYDVTGFVRNLSDGRVELVAEGPEEAVTQFLDDVGSRLQMRIDSTESDQTEATGEFANFSILY